MRCCPFPGPYNGAAPYRARSHAECLPRVSLHFTPLALGYEVLPLAFPFGRLPLVQGALPCGMFTQGVAPFHSACPGLRGVAPSGRVAMRFAVRVGLYQ